MPAKILLIRHGSTLWNARQRYCGFKDVSLSAKGRKQARRLYQRLKSQKVDKVYSSDLKRAVQTAGIVFNGAAILRIKGLREMNFGIFEGMTYREIQNKYPDIYQRWIADPFNITIPGGENLRVFKKRVVEAMKNIISRKGPQVIAVVCHGGVISIYLNHILKSDDFWKHIPQSASLTVLSRKNGKLSVELLNDSAHLKGIIHDIPKFKE